MKSNIFTFVTKHLSSLFSFLARHCREIFGCCEECEENEES